MRVKHLLLLVPGFLVIAGCGGTGLLNPFIGTYNGTWTQSSPSASGTSHFLVLPGGTVSGSLHDSGVNLDYTMAGTMSDTGTFDATIVPTSGTTLNLHGTMAFNQANHLIGAITVTGNGTNTVNFDMTPQ